MAGLDIVQKRFQDILVHAKIGNCQRHIVDDGVSCRRKLPNSINGIVIVRRQEESAALCERVTLADVFERTGRIRREHGSVLTSRSSEIIQHMLTCFLDQARRCRRTEAAGMGIAEYSRI